MKDKELDKILKTLAETCKQNSDLQKKQQEIVDTLIDGQAFIITKLENFAESLGYNVGYVPKEIVHDNGIC